MLHRRLLVDDRRGVDEPLNETEAIRTLSVVQLGSPSDGARVERSSARLWLTIAAASRAQRRAALEINEPIVYAFGKPVSCWCRDVER